MTYKKIGCLIAAVTGIVFPISAQHIEDYASGRERVVSIMSHKETGVAAYNNKNVHCAETRNLSVDLDIPHIANFFGCKTTMGTSFLVETLTMPTSGQDKDSILARRQHAIRMLVENPALKEEVERLLESAQQEEQEVIKMMSDFFMGKTCPELKSLELLKKQNPRLVSFYDFILLNPTGKTIFSAMSAFSCGFFWYLTCKMSQVTYQLAQVGSPYGQAAGYTGYYALLAGFYTYTHYKDYANASEKRSKLHSLNQLITIAERCEELCVQHAIANQFKMSDIQDAEGIKLVQQLKASRYEKKNTVFFMLPFVHTFLYKVYEQEKHLAEVFACIAEMDAYNAIANKIIESRSTKNKVCFVTFVESEKPQIRAEAFWNVLVKDAVCNTLSVENNIILTGPNAGGKTTAIRAILQNIVLAQTFGVAAAETCEMTMFDVIHSYLTISDDLLHGLSLFASEVKRAQEILEKIKTLDPNKKFFFALDELFTGTVAEDGEVCAYEFVKKIADFEGVQFIYATHFNKLKELGEDHAGCVNYKVDAPVKNADGKLIYPYTVNRGASQSRVALDIARAAHLFA